MCSFQLSNKIGKPIVLDIILIPEQLALPLVSTSNYFHQYLLELDR
jgi:hypothetical protein